MTDDVDEDEEDEEDEVDEEGGGTKTWTRSMLSLVFPLGSCPCGCAGGSPPGTAGRGWRCMFAHSVNELHLLARDQGP